MNKILYKKPKSIDTKSMNIIRFFYNFILVFLGCLLSSIGTACFLLPNQLSSGGFSGVATIFYYLFNIKMSTVIILLNIPLFIIGYFKLGFKFTIRSMIATILFSKLIDIFKVFNFNLNDRFLASIYGGILIGTGLALLFKSNTSTGGTDLIAHIAQNYKTELKMSSIIIGMDALIVLSNLIVFKDLEVGLYSAIAIFIIGKMIDIVFEGINFCKIIYIISDEYDKIEELINSEAQRGATSIYGRGSFTKKDKMIIMCVTKRKEIEKIKKISKKIDSKAFIIITDAREVFGQGFK